MLFEGVNLIEQRDASTKSGIQICAPGMEKPDHLGGAISALDSHKYSCQIRVFLFIHD